MTRTGIVVSVGRVSYPPADHETVVQVITDHPAACERAFYLRLGEPEPQVGASVTYGDRHATWREGGYEVTARKRGCNFDPAAPLR